MQVRAGDTVTYLEMIATLRKRLDEVLLPLIPADRPCAVVGFPLHANAGDSALWLAERAMLMRAGSHIVYACDRESYDRSELASRLHGGTIFIHGGGSLGDVWWRGLEFIKRIVADFPDHHVVLFPQWICFRDRESLKGARTTLNAHPDLIILARDRASLERARNEFRAKALLCPDMALTLGPLPRAGPPSADVVWLARTDRESAWPEPAAVADVAPFDWRQEPPFLAPRAARRILPWLNRRVQPPGWRQAGRLWLYDLIARGRLAWGRRLLCRGRVVITDRLHGYVLSLLQGIPHVVLDTRFGKTRAFYETWGESCDLTRWAGSPEEALRVARSLLQRTRETSQR
ncbi:MAG: polysaccharide pyruvyl transferase family protein [bacterium]|nr:polysaccharide pyruvyl transferase family protein [bacterium]